MPTNRGSTQRGGLRWIETWPPKSPNTFRIEGDLRKAVTELKDKTPQGVLVGSLTLSSALEQLGLIDEYRIVVHPVLAGHGPRLFPGLQPSRRLELVSTYQLKAGQLALHYRRKEG